MKILKLRLLKIIWCSKRKYLKQQIEKDAVFARAVQGKIIGKRAKIKRRKKICFVVQSIFNILKYLKIQQYFYIIMHVIITFFIRFNRFSDETQFFKLEMEKTPIRNNINKLITVIHTKNVLLTVHPTLSIKH